MTPAVVQINVDQVVGIVIGGIAMQGVVLAIGFVAFRSEMRAQIRALKETSDTIRRALGLDGSDTASFLPRNEFDAFADQSREDRKEIHSELARVDGVIERHAEAIHALRRKGA